MLDFDKFTEVSIWSSHDPNDEDSVQNLINNIGNRQSTSLARPLIYSPSSPDPLEPLTTSNVIKANQRSCFIAEIDVAAVALDLLLRKDIDNVVIRVDHGREIFQNGVLLVTDMLFGDISDNTDNTLLKGLSSHSWHVYIGNDPNHYSLNTHCGGPFLDSGFKDYDDAYAGASVPDFGFDAWCNLPGQYTYFTTVGYIAAMVVCDLGVFGTVFIRDEPLY